MKPILDAQLQKLLGCPQCKIALVQAGAFGCPTCGRRFSQSPYGVWDFTLRYPPFFTPVSRSRWRDTQDWYENWSKEIARHDDYDIHLRELGLVADVYTSEFKLSGTVLDVGGLWGQLRHFLAEGSTYLSIDPCPFPFTLLQAQPNLLRVYPRLLEDCNFVNGEAEYLPLLAESFDYVHLRSVLDHFMDPVQAMFEARRVLKPTGKILVGVHVTGGQSPIPGDRGIQSMMGRARRKLANEGLAETAKALGRRFAGTSEEDKHIWHPTYNELSELFAFAGFSIDKVHWQKPPYDHVVYMLGSKASLPTDARSES